MQSRSFPITARGRQAQTAGPPRLEPALPTLSQAFAIADRDHKQKDLPGARVFALVVFIDLQS